jgi:hypothetical protein
LLSDAERALLVSRCRALPPSGDYAEDDYVANLLLTVLDFQMREGAVAAALAHYRLHRWHEVRTHGDLAALLARHPDDNEGHTRLARHLWGHRHFVRAALLRALAGYLGEIGVTTQERLRRWAAESTFEADFEGRVRVTIHQEGKRPRTWGLGYAVYNWLLVRLRIETVKPDLHIHRFVASVLGRSLGDREVVEALSSVAQELGLAAYELDWRIWEHQRGRAANSG